MRQFLIITLAFLCYRPCFAPPVGVLVDVTTIEGQLLLLRAILARHPGLVNENLAYRRNLLEILADVVRVQQALGANAAALEIGDTRLIGGVFFGAAADYDRIRIDTLKSTLSQNAEVLRLDTFTNLAGDLGRLKDLNLFNGEKEAQFRAFFRLLPLIYDADGNALVSTPAEIIDSIEKISDGELDNGYQDRFRNYLRPRAGEALGDEAQIKGWLDNTNNQFVKNEVIPQFAPKSAEGQRVSRRTISVEPVPPIIGLLVRNFGRDCGLGSVPFFPLLAHTQVYLIRDSLEPNAKPKGYVFVAEVEMDGKRLPYIVTLNGVSLSEADFKAAIRMIAADRGVNQVILPRDPLDTQSYLANTTPARQALAAGKRTSVKVSLPEDWDKLTRPEFRHANYKENKFNYYDPAGLADAQLIDVDSLEIPLPEAPRVVNRSNPYLLESPEQFAHISLIERAVLAADATRGMRKNNPLYSRLRELLDVTPEQILSGLNLREATRDKPLNLAAFRRAQSRINLKLEDLQYLDNYTRAHSLALIFKQDQAITKIHPRHKTIASELEWRRIFQAATRTLDNEAIQRDAAGAETFVLPPGNNLIDWSNAQLDLPLEFQSSWMAQPQFLEDLHSKLKDSNNYPENAADVLRKYAESRPIPDQVFTTLNDYLAIGYSSMSITSARTLADIAKYRLLPDSTFDVFLRNLSSTNKDVRILAGAVLAKISAHQTLPEKLIETISQDLSLPSSGATEGLALAANKALRAIASHCVLPESAFPPLLSALNGKDYSNYTMAAETLGQIAQHQLIPKSVFDKLSENLLPEKNESLRENFNHAILALEKIAAFHPIPLSVLERAVHLPIGPPFFSQIWDLGKEIATDLKKSSKPTPEQLQMVHLLLAYSREFFGNPGRGVVEHWLEYPGTREHVAGLFQQRGIILLPEQLTLDDFERDVLNYDQLEDRCQRATRSLVM